jgi:hypothetical protein
MPTLRGLLFAFTGYEMPWTLVALSVVVVAAVAFIAWRANLEFALAFALSRREEQNTGGVSARAMAPRR